MDITAFRAGHLPLEHISGAGDQGAEGQLAEQPLHNQQIKSPKSQLRSNKYKYEKHHKAIYVVTFIKI